MQADILRDSWEFLKEGAAADVIVTDYIPLTPMNADNANSHILFGMTGRSVVTTVCNGKGSYERQNPYGN